MTAISSLNGILNEFTPLTLFNDPDDCVDSLQDYLFNILRTLDASALNDRDDDKKGEATSFGGTEDKKDQKKRGHERRRSKKSNSIASVTPKLARYPSSSMVFGTEAVEALIGLVIARGSALGSYFPSLLYLEEF